MLAYMLSTTLYRRKKIGLLATQRWGESLPKFKSPDTKQQLTEFASRITPECGIPELNFNADGIARHIKNFFTEQRRYRKIKTTSCKVCFLLARDFDKGSLMCVLGNFLLMLLLSSFLILRNLKKRSLAKTFKNTSFRNCCPHWELTWNATLLVFFLFWNCLCQ